MWSECGRTTRRLYRSEILGEFRARVSTLFDPDAIAACVAQGVRERAPEPGIRYFGFTDAASGSGSDAFTVAVAHAEGERAVLDVVRAWRSPFNPSGVIAEAADLLKRYLLRTTSGDRYAPGFVAEALRAQGITYYPSERDRSEIRRRLLFVGEGKDSETPNCRATQARLQRYLQWIAAHFRHGSASAVCAVCFGREADALTWLRALAMLEAEVQVTFAHKAIVRFEPGLLVVYAIAGVRSRRAQLRARQSASKPGKARL